MRQQISQEGLTDLPGQYWMPGCHKWEEDKELTVMLNSDFSNPDNIIGKATDIRREDDGRITAEIEYFVDAVPPEMATTVYCNKAKWHFFNETIFIEDAMIRAIFLTVSAPWAAGWPEFKLEGTSGA